jgi:hypothetical protein
MNKSGKAAAKAEKRAPPCVSVEVLAMLGTGEIAYVLALTPGETKKMFPEMKDLPENTVYFALKAADGTPIMLADTREAAAGFAWEKDLELISLH